MKKPKLPAPQPVQLSQDEIAALEARRAQDAAMKACAEEIAATLKKYGFALQAVAPQPQIVLTPVQRQE